MSSNSDFSVLRSRSERLRVLLDQSSAGKARKSEYSDIKLLIKRLVLFLKRGWLNFEDQICSTYSGAFAISQTNVKDTVAVKIAWSNIVWVSIRQIKGSKLSSNGCIWRSKQRQVSTSNWRATAEVNRIIRISTDEETIRRVSISNDNLIISVSIIRSVTQMTIFLNRGLTA